MKLNYITFMVRDVGKTIDFYQQLAGLKIIKKFNPGNGEIVFMADSKNSTNLEFIHFDNVPKVETSGMTISFKVEGELEDIRERAITMGCVPTKTIEKAPKPAHFLVKDPDGIEVEFSL